MPAASRLPIRPAAVAGRFYPASPRELASSVARYLDQAVPGAAGAVPPALIAPHAGYVYSGPVAGSAFAAWSALRGKVQRVVLLGPAHYVAVDGVALSGASAFATPLGEVPVDAETCARVAELPFVVAHPAAHAPEHALEVELPFLQGVLGDFSVVPLLVGDASPGEVAQVLALAWSGPETVVVVSSDLSHYLPYEVACRVDRATSEQIREPRAPLDGQQACGARAINGLLVEAKRRGLAAEIVDLRNSGDTAGGKDQVVGYGAFAFRSIG